MQGLTSPMDLSDFIERTLQAKDAGSLIATLKGALADLGFPHLVCGAIGGHGVYNSALPAPAVVLDYPMEWQRHYFDRNYLAIDPIVARAPFARGPFHWGQLVDLTPVQRRFFDEARECGLAQGMAVPIHGPAGEVFVAGLAGPHGDVDPVRSLTAANILISQFHAAWMALVAPGAPQAPVQLTLRERECLLWSARGKSSWDIGTILRISENTVNFHLKNAMHKLDAATRIMAIVKAIRMGLVVP